MFKIRQLSTTAAVKFSVGGIIIAQRWMLKVFSYSRPKEGREPHDFPLKAWFFFLILKFTDKMVPCEARTGFSQRPW